MNIVPTYPNMVPLAQQPATELAKRDNVRRERIPEPESSQNSAFNQTLSSDEQPNTYVPMYQGTTSNFKGDTYTPTSLKEAAQSYLQNDSGVLTDEAIEGQSSTDDEEQQNSDAQNSSESNESFTKEEQKTIDDLKARDQEVKTHEQAHKSAGGQYAGSPAFDMTRGPDGKDYATGGHVDIDVSAVANDPQATINKMAQIKKAALAPAEPSSQDMKVAAKADMVAAAARAELTKNNESSVNPETQTATSDSSSSSQNSDNPFVDEQMRQRGVVVLNRYLMSGRQDATALSQYA